MNNFLMSFRFNKDGPQDFGLSYENCRFFRNSDGTEWCPCQLYDFGWGEENGFYRVPLGSFDELMQLVLNDDDLEDSYGAAAMIQNIYPTELKAYLLSLMCQDMKFRDKKILKKINHFFRLDKGVRFLYSANSSIAEEEKNCEDWKKITEFFSK